MDWIEQLAFGNRQGYVQCRENGVWVCSSLSSMMNELFFECTVVEIILCNPTTVVNMIIVWVSTVYLLCWWIVWYDCKSVMFVYGKGGILMVFLRKRWTRLGCAPVGHRVSLHPHFRVLWLVRTCLFLADDIRRLGTLCSYLESVFSILVWCWCHGQSYRGDGMKI